MTAHETPRAQAGAGAAESSGVPSAYSALRWFNVGLRGVMELGVVAGLASWGLRTGGSTGVKALLAVAAPAIGFGIWAAVDFRRAGRLSEPLRLVEELLISAVAAAAWYVAGQHAAALALGAASIVNHALVYALGDRLLTRDS